MSVFVDNLESCVMSNAATSDEIVVISGYFSVDIIEKIAKLGKKTKFYYGMYLRNGISKVNYDAFTRLESSYPNLKINIPVAYHVHTKCYIFKNEGAAINVLVGSANASSSALATTPNSELLTPVADPADKIFIEEYAAAIAGASVHYDSPLIVPSLKTKTLAVSAKRSKKEPGSWNRYTGDPFSAIIPLYYLDKKGKPVVHHVDGLNWGNGPHASKDPDMESVLPLRAFHFNHYPLLIPFNGEVGSGTGGKIQRRQNPIEMTWDDGTKMIMLFQQGGKKVERAPGVWVQYPKALTASSGGLELGRYLRKRMGIDTEKELTYDDLRKYGRDYVTLTLTKAGEYELDFGV